MHQSAIKIKAYVFWDEHDILSINYLGTGHIISPRQFTLLQVDRNENKTEWMAPRIAFAFTVSSRFGPSDLSTFRLPQKMITGRSEK